MLSDDFPVFHIDLDCDFESSDNLFPPFKQPPSSSKKQAPKTKLEQNETTTIFSAIGERKDNLDRVIPSLFSVSSSEGNPSHLWLSSTGIAIHNLSTISKPNSSTNWSATPSCFRNPLPHSPKVPLSLPSLLRNREISYRKILEGKHCPSCHHHQR